jgi:hypothetical protein
MNTVDFAYITEPVLIEFLNEGCIGLYFLIRKSSIYMKHLSRIKLSTLEFAHICQRIS